MKAIVHSLTGDSDVLHLAERATPEPGPGEVRVRVVVSGVNPTDWKSRRGTHPSQATPFPQMVPNEDGAGIVDALGAGVTTLQVGQRVWMWEAAWGRADGTAQEQVILPVRQVVALPDHASFDLGASLGIPALTAHRCLTVAEGSPVRLHPDAMLGQMVLVAGGAGAVGHAAIQLARWAGASVITTVSSSAKAELARLAGADHVVNYHDENAAATILAIAPNGVNVVVEVDFAANQALDREVAAPGATVAVYAATAGSEVTLPLRDHMLRNTRFQFVLVYTVSSEAKDAAVSAVRAVVADGALTVGAGVGLPVIRYPLERTADAHDAVEAGAIGKVLIDVSRP
jgi:NADPH2:quinone reductase